jgi:cytochrome c peroxidase
MDLFEACLGCGNWIPTRPGEPTSYSSKTACHSYPLMVLRGIKDSPPYLHDGRLLTLEDAVEFV